MNRIRFALTNAEAIGEHPGSNGPAVEVPVTQSVPGLRKLEVSILRDKTSADSAQVPATATIQVYRQGAVSKTDETLPPNLTPDDPIVVSDVGAIRKGDTLGIFRNGAWQPGYLVVDIVHNATTLEATNRSSQTVHLQHDDRLIPTNHLLKLLGRQEALSSTPRPSDRMLPQVTQERMI